MSHFFNYDPKLLKKIIYKSKKKNISHTPQSN